MLLGWCWKPSQPQCLFSPTVVDISINQMSAFLYGIHHMEIVALVCAFIFLSGNANANNTDQKEVTVRI